MANFLDPIRNAVDALDDKIKAADVMADAAAKYPVLGPIIAPYVGIFDEFRSIADSARQALDALDPVATAAIAAAPAATKTAAAAATTAATA